VHGEDEERLCVKREGQEKKNKYGKNRRDRKRIE